MAETYGHGRAARINRNRFGEVVRDVAQSIAALKDRDLSPDARKSEAGRLNDDARARLRQSLAASGSLLVAAEMERLTMSPEARRVEAAFQRPERAAAVRALLQDATADVLERFATLAATEGDRAAAWGVLAATEGRDLPREVRAKISTSLNVPDADYVRVGHEITAIKNEMSATELEAIFAGLDLQVTRKWSHPGASPAEIAAAYEALGLEGGPHPAAPELGIPGVIAPVPGVTA